MLRDSSRLMQNRAKTVAYRDKGRAGYDPGLLLKVYLCGLSKPGALMEAVLKAVVL